MEQDKIKNKQIKLKPKAKLIIYLILFLVSSGLIYYVTYTVYIEMNKDKNTFIMNYSNEMNLNYEVCVKDNPYYLEKCLGMDKQYPYSIINDIKYNITNSLKASRTMNVTYSYKVIANLISETVAKDVPKEELWNKEYVLVPTVSKTEDTNKINITQDFVIDYEFYEKLMEEYRQAFQVQMHAYLKISYILNLDNDKENIHEEIVLHSYVPMLEPVVKIYSFVPNNINKNIFVDKSNIMDYSYFLLIDLLLVILNGLLIYKASKIQFAVDLDGKVNKLIKLYEEAIIVVKELPSN
ncbi:MAG: hypothetical protein RR189_02540, partial [Bacilli bacterium]